MGTMGRTAHGLSVFDDRADLSVQFQLDNYDETPFCNEC